MMKLSQLSRTNLILIGGLALIALLGLFLYFSGMMTFNLVDSDEKEYSTTINEATVVEDLKSLENVKPDFASVREFFVDIAKKQGGVQAFEVLRRAILPPNTDIHLMGHAVGDELYKQEGLEGMQYCTHDFRNACSHSIVVGALLAEGLSVFDRVNEICKNAPGGPGAYTMCFHGFGHGVLAYTEYEVPEAVKLCSKVGTEQYHKEEEAQCIGGIIMEMHQGVHDPEIWAQKKDKYLDPTKPLKLCQEDYMPELAKVLCYSYITPFIFDAAGAQGGNPTPEIYKESFAFCDGVENDAHREACYAGLGKEFIVLAQDRDIRRIEDTPDDLLQLAASWCMLAEKEEAERACLTDILDSIFWGGENDFGVSVRYCSLLTPQSISDTCFLHLFQIASYYVPQPNRRENICSLVPENQKKQCSEKLF